MSPDQIADVARSAIYTLLWVSAPAMLVALIVGVVIGLLQALTSVQEMTITFVPKILLVFLSLILFMPWMSDRILVFTQELFARIASGGSG